MDKFWYTPQTYKNLFGNDFKSIPFYGAIHIAELLITIGLSFALFRFYKKANKATRRRTLLVLTVLIILDEILKYVATISTDQWLWQYLPLHLCSINIFVCTIHTITESDKVKDFLYAVCIPGAMLALLMPSWFVAPVFNVMHIHSFTIHALLLIYSVVVLADGYRPNLRRIPYNAMYLILMTIPIYFLNKLLNTNFMFTNKPNEVFLTEWLYKLFGNYYIFAFPFILIIIWIIIYIPWLMKPKKSIA